MNACENLRMSEWMRVWISELAHEWVCVWECEGMSEWLGESEYMSEWAKECVKESEGMSEWLIE